MSKYPIKKFGKGIDTNATSRAHEKHIRNTLDEHGNHLGKFLKKTITTGSRSGRTYTYKGQSYTASAPGEPPADRSGRLANSFGYERKTASLTIFSTAFSDRGAPYPSFLETGTKKMKSRPYFKKNIEENEYQLERQLRGYHGP